MSRDPVAKSHRLTFSATAYPVAIENPDGAYFIRFTLLASLRSAIKSRVLQSLQLLALKALP